MDPGMMIHAVLGSANDKEFKAIRYASDVSSMREETVNGVMNSRNLRALWYIVKAARIRRNG